MNIIIPLGGKGERFKNNGYNNPKPLINIAGKAIVERLVEDIAKICSKNIEEIAFIIGDFGKKVDSLVETKEKDIMTI